jgi:hypothetical protein
MTYSGTAKAAPFQSPEAAATGHEFEAPRNVRDKSRRLAANFLTIVKV